MEREAEIKVCGVKRQERRGVGEVARGERTHEDEAAFAARLRPITLLLPLSSASPLLSFPLRPHPSLSPLSLTFSISALTIHVLSAATDP